MLNAGLLLARAMTDGLRTVSPRASAESLQISYLSSPDFLNR